MELFIIPKNGDVEPPIYATRMRQWPRGITIREHLSNGVTEFFDNVEKCNMLITLVNGEWHNQLGAGAEVVMSKWHRRGVLRRAPSGAFYLNQALYYQVEMYSMAFSDKPASPDITPEEVEWLAGLVQKKPENRTLDEEIMNSCTYPYFGPFDINALPVMHLAPNGQIDIDRAILKLAKKGYLLITVRVPFSNKPAVRLAPGSAAKILLHEAQHREIVEGANCLAKVLDGVDGQ